VAKAKVVKTKKCCCQKRPRCKRCPVVYKRLAAMGYAERKGKRRWKVVTVPPKKRLKAARS